MLLVSRLVFYLLVNPIKPITRSPAQKPAHKDLGRNDQSAVITSKDANVLVYAHNAFASPETCT
ncbi:alpha-galactosidase [Lacticaseibacillus rhamnosus]|nr:alpha-galactosidase [Lacticaseibacillus rhamnosus]MCT3182027.1 alpha-galactosidase [Lacticaseibacillus rhamnosus]